MLTEEEKLRIRSEEVFRSEVSRQFEANQSSTHRQKLWSLLNSSFALWFLSSVVLATLTTAVTYYQAKRGEQVRKSQAELRLDTEISSRIRLALRGARLDRSRIEQGALYPPETIYQNIQFYLDNSFVTRSSHLYDFSVYPEYQARTFRSLLFELASVVDPRDRSEMTDALVIYEKVLDFGSPPPNEKHQNATPQTVDSAIQLLSPLIKRRWQSLLGSQEPST